MSLIEASNNLSPFSSVEALERFNKILGSSQVTVSFWGKRQITYNSEQVAIDELAKKVSRVAYLCKEKGLDELRREQWIIASSKISFFYDKSDVALRNKNFITRLFVSIREFAPLSYPERFYFKEGFIESDFRSYSKKDLKTLKRTLGRVVTDGDLVTVETIRRKAGIDRYRLRRGEDS